MMCFTAKGDGLLSCVGGLGDIFQWISNQSTELVSRSRSN